MAKRRGNPNWGKPEPIGPIVPTVTEFEQVVKEYKLTPDQYLRSTRLREWARGHGGHATLYRAADKKIGAFQPLPDALAGLHRRLKGTFDPAGILNPRRLYPDF